VLSQTDGSREYREPSEAEKHAFIAASEKLSQLVKANTKASRYSYIPSEALSHAEPRRLNVMHYGFDNWGSLFNDRQKLAILTFSEVLEKAFDTIKQKQANEEFATAICTILGLCLSNILQYNCNMSTWLSDGMISVFIQSSSIPMRADYAEANPLMSKLAGGFEFQLTRIRDTLLQLCGILPYRGTAVLGSATSPLLPNDAADAVVTDPPYYFAIPYAELSDFFYVWIKRIFQRLHPDLLRFDTTPKADEAIQNLPHSKGVEQKDKAHFETKIRESLIVAREEVKPSGIAIVVFAHASTEGWEALLNALLGAGWVITGSWPIDTEREGRMLASRQRALASSVHLVCRPRENPDGSLRSYEIGDWRDVLHELPQRIHEWMPRLRDEGVVGADAIFACLGPALEVFSRYSYVEKASGEQVTLKEYLEYVWAAVAKEALNMIFEGADARGFEEDARLTAMWLWTLSTTSVNGDGGAKDDTEDTEETDDETKGKAGKASGFSLEYDAARKIAQGLGVNLENLTSVVEITGNTARLLSVSERTNYLFPRHESQAPTRQKKKSVQPRLFEGFGEDEKGDGSWGDKTAPKLGDTVLDHVHQSMILFAAGRGEALKRFIIEEGAGNNPQFWRLAQALSALYPSGGEEKRWVDGVLARKKSLGF
jgi:adenine-specific DNA methylase